VAAKPDPNVEAMDILDKQDVADKLNAERAARRVVQRENRRLRHALDLREELRGARTLRIPKRRSKSKGKDPHTQCHILSDTHTYEIIRKEEVGGRNEHTPEIGKRRLENYYVHAVKRWHMFSKWYDIQDIFFPHIGDYLVNAIMHPPDSMDATHASPIEEAKGVLEIMEGGLRYVLENTDARLMVPCLPGNHGRMTQDKRLHNASAYSLEHWMHQILADRFRKEDRIQVEAYSLDCTVSVGGVRFYLHHGDNVVRGGNGLPGQFINAYKRMLDDGNDFDMMILGHVHQANYFFSRGFTNGSLCGMNEYAYNKKLRYERAQQVGFLVAHNEKEVGTVFPYWGD